MANEQNLIPQYHKLTVEEAKKGGKKSVESRRAKKTIKNLLNDYLESDCKDSEVTRQLAAKLGLKGKDSIKQLVTAKCVLNTLKRGDVRELALLQEILEEKETEGEEVQVIIDV